MFEVLNKSLLCLKYSQSVCSFVVVFIYKSTVEAFILFYFILFFFFFRCKHIFLKTQLRLQLKI